MDEKRRSSRIRTNAVVSFRVQSARLAGGSRVKDISESGVCIPSKNYFPLESILELEIRSDDLSEPLKVLARVVRITSRDKGKFLFEVGLVFLQITPVKRNLISHYIQRVTLQGGNQDISWLE